MDRDRCQRWKKKMLLKHLVNCFEQVSKLGLNSPISVTNLSENKKP